MECRIFSLFTATTRRVMTSSLAPWKERREELHEQELTNCQAWLSVWIRRTAAQGVVTVAVGGTAALTAPVTVNITAFAWYRGTAVSDPQLIITYIVSPPAQTNGPLYTGRESGSTSGTLNIRDLRTSDTDTYTVTVTPTTGATTTAHRQLRVYEILSKPSLVTSSGLEFNGYNMTLKCETRNQIAETYQFRKGDRSITCDQQRITCTSSSPFLYFHPIITFDSGNYTCAASNPISGITSDPLEILVKDRPCPTPGSSWPITLGVACGVLLGAAIIVAGIVVHYERRLKQRGTNKDENVNQNPSVIKNANAQYDNVGKGREGQSANQGPAADPAYMELKHGDRDIYEQMKSPKAQLPTQHT